MSFNHHHYHQNQFKNSIDNLRKLFCLYCFSQSQTVLLLIHTRLDGLGLIIYLWMYVTFSFLQILYNNK